MDDGYIWLKYGELYEEGDEVQDIETGKWSCVSDSLAGTAYPAFRQVRRKRKEGQPQQIHDVIEEPLESTPKRSLLSRIFSFKN